MPPPTNFRNLLISRLTGTSEIELVTLNRPNRLNALSMDMVDDLLNYFQHLDQANFYNDSNEQQQPRIVILKGMGKSFCAGLDLTESASTNGFGSPNTSIHQTYQIQRRISEIIVRMRRCPQPIISLLHGAVCGGGLALALASDVRLATTDLKCNIAMATIGLSGCDVGISYLLPRAIGSSRANEMCLTGRFVNATKAEMWGLVNEVLPNYAALETAGLTMAQDMLKLSPLATQLTKQGMTLSTSASSLESQIALEDRQQTITSRDAVFLERVQKFVEKKSSSKL